MANAVEVKLPAMWECNSWVGRLSLDDAWASELCTEKTPDDDVVYKGDRLGAWSARENFGDREWDSLNIVVAMKNQLT